MIRFILAAALALLPLAVNAQGVSSGGSPPAIIAPGADLSTGNVTATRSTTARTTAARAAQQLNVKDGCGATGATGTLQSWSDGAIATGTTAFTSTSATFTLASVGLNIAVSGSGAAGIAQSGTITAYTSAHAVTVSFTAATTVTGATYNYGVDDSAAFVACENLAVSQTLAGLPTDVYIPAGNYLIKAQTLPTMTSAGVGVFGDGTHKTDITIDPSYTGDLFSWSNAWMATAYNAVYIAASADQSGPVAANMTIFGNSTAATRQNAFRFYDRNDHVLMQNVEMYDIAGSCLEVGTALNGTPAYMRESKFYNIQCWYSGTSTVPSVDLSTAAAGSGDATNELSFYGLDIQSPTGRGLVIRNGNTAGGTRLIRFYGLRVEAATTGDLVTIGDPTLTGNVNTIKFYGFEGNGSANNYNTITLTAPNSAVAPYDIAVEGSIGTGTGGGVNIAAGRSIYLNFHNMNTTQNEITVASNTTVGGPIVLDGYGGENGWTKSVDATSTAFLFYPVRTNYTNTYGGLLSNATGQANSLTGNYEFGAGFLNTLSGPYSFGSGFESADSGRSMQSFQLGRFITNGDAQHGLEVLMNSGSGTSAFRLTEAGGAASSANCINIGANKAYSVRIQLHARDYTTPGTDYDWVLPTGMLTRDTTIGTTMWAGSTPVIATRGTTTGAAVVASADTTNGCLSLTFAPPTANTTDVWHAVAHVETVEVQ